MKDHFKMCFILCFFLVGVFFEVEAQLTVFTGLKSNAKLADYYQENGNYQELLNLYSFMAEKERYKPQIFVQLARTYRLLNEPRNSLYYFDKFREKDSLNKDDLLKYIQLFVEVNNREKALEELKKYVKKISKR